MMHVHHVTCDNLINIRVPGFHVVRDPKYSQSAPEWMWFDELLTSFLLTLCIPVAQWVAFVLKCIKIYKIDALRKQWIPLNLLWLCRDFVPFQYLSTKSTNLWRKKLSGLLSGFSSPYNVDWNSQIALFHLAFIIRSQLNVIHICWIQTILCVV